jgi:hypothetical protein
LRTRRWAALFVRPEVKRQLKQAAIQLRSEQRQLRAGHAAERRLEQEVRQRADEQIAAEREQERRYRKDFAEWLRRRPGGGGCRLSTKPRQPVVGRAASIGERNQPRDDVTRLSVVTHSM